MGLGQNEIARELRQAFAASVKYSSFLSSHPSRKPHAPPASCVTAMTIRASTLIYTRADLFDRGVLWQRGWRDIHGFPGGWQQPS